MTHKPNFLATTLYRLGLATLALQVLGALGATSFYVYLVAEFTAGRVKLGLGGLAVAGYILAISVCMGFALISAFVFFFSMKRARFWRIAAPIPALAATVGFGVWLFSGDPGDEYWLQHAFAAEAGALVITIVAAILSPRPQHKSERR